MKILSMRPVYPEWYNHVVAIEKHGFRWMSWVGIPIRGTANYPEKQRVRQLLSPEQLASERWTTHLAENDGREAEGHEPLAYSYCSSGCNVEPVPDVINNELSVDLSRAVHEACDSAPHDIGSRQING